MSKSGILEIEKRDSIGGSKVKRLRKNGFIPAIIYGKGIEPVPVTVKKSDFRESIIKNGKNAVFNVEVEKGKPFPIIIKEIAYDNLKNEYVHVDLQVISLTEKRRASVPIRIIGREVIEMSKNVLIHQMDQVDVECLPLDMPEYFEADASEMKTGENFTAGQLDIPDNISLISSPDDVIFSITEAKEIPIETEETEEAGEVEEGAEAAETVDESEVKEKTEA
jgi:large subunit ribosomal protein L25